LLPFFDHDHGPIILPNTFFFGKWQNKECVMPPQPIYYATLLPP
jgi:hypothetical protein